MNDIDTTWDDRHEATAMIFLFERGATLLRERGLLADLDARNMATRSCSDPRDVVKVLRAHGGMTEEQAADALRQIREKALTLPVPVELRPGLVMRTAETLSPEHLPLTFRDGPNFNNRRSNADAVVVRRAGLGCWYVQHEGQALCAVYRADELRPAGAEGASPDELVQR